MPGHRVIDLHVLRAAVAGALNACEATLGSAVTVDIDHYWHLPVDAAVDMTREPPALTVGQLSDDLAEISAVTREPESAWHDLAHVIGVLRALEARVRP